MKRIILFFYFIPLLSGLPALHAISKAKDTFIDSRSYKNKIVILNAWNEWTEGSYLLPEERTGTKYLEAVKHVFGE